MNAASSSKKLFLLGHSVLSYAKMEMGATTIAAAIHRTNEIGASKNKVICAFTNAPKKEGDCECINKCAVYESDLDKRDFLQ
jgi:hypothetical protein